MKTKSTAAFLESQQNNLQEFQTESEAKNIIRAPDWYASLLKLKALWRCVLVTFILGVPATATAGTWTTLDVDGEMVQTYRDDFGRPHIFAETNRALFVAAGYTAAEDRLWQMILNVRASRGTLAEAFGSASLASDILVRTVGYTDAELDTQLAELPASEQLVFKSYADGVNRYLADARLDPANKLPFEFFAAGLGVPEDLSVRDIVAFTGFAMRRFAEVGGQELANKQTLDALTAKYGAAGYGIFSDMRWLNDPDVPATIPTDGAIGRRQHIDTPASDSQLNGPTGLITDEEAVNEHWKQLGIPNRLGSFGWVVSAQKSTEGYPMLYSGPQMGFAGPEIVHEVQLKSDEGVNVTGMTMPGLPWVVIGHNKHLAWAMTSGLAGDNVDVYIEATYDAGAGAGSGYIYNGACTPYDIRSETIAVRGAAATTVIVRHSIHGPVVAALGSYTATQKRAHWMAELSSARAVGDINRATNIHAFEDAVSRFALALNFFYADQQGNIGYWLAGRNPLRAPGFDPRLPLPGDGSAEWLDGYRPIRKSINPAQGWLANWNNKPTAEYADGDGGLIFSAEPFGGMHRYSDLAQHFEQTHISLQDMRDIPKDIARVNVVNRNGREARLLLPYLFKALDAVPPQHPVAAQARAVLEGWDGSMFADSAPPCSPARSSSPLGWSVRSPTPSATN